MNANISLSVKDLEHEREMKHPHCVVCNPSNQHGLRIAFVTQADGSVTGEFSGGAIFEGYPGLLHGGIAAALADGAMTNCLFAHGIEAYTAELMVRYREPVDACHSIGISARIMESHGRLHVLRSELRQDGRVKVIARAKFMETKLQQHHSICDSD